MKNLIHKGVRDVRVDCGKVEFGHKHELDGISGQQTTIDHETVNFRVPES